MGNAILCCDCQGIPERARAAFKVKFKGEAPVYAGRNAISGLWPKLEGNIAEYVRGLIRNKDKFAYYMEWDMDGTVTLQYNLLNGRNVL